MVRAMTTLQPLVLVTLGGPRIVLHWQGRQLAVLNLLPSEMRLMAMRQPSRAPAQMTLWEMEREKLATCGHRTLHHRSRYKNPAVSYLLKWARQARLGLSGTLPLTARRGLMRTTTGSTPQNECHNRQNLQQRLSKMQHARHRQSLTRSPLRADRPQ